MTARSGKSLRPRDFFAAHPVFTHAEFVAWHTTGGRSPHTSNSILARRTSSGRLLRIRRGLYAVVPPGLDPESFAPDSYLVATKLRGDAVVAYHAALAFHGKACSVWHRVQFLTAARPRPLDFRGIEYAGVQAPVAVRHLPDFGGGVLVRPHAGSEVRVTSLERCLVDLLHSPEHGGGWEEICRSLAMVEYLDLDQVIEFTVLMGSALTAGRVGFLLERHREEWMVEERHLEALARRAPAQPTYLDRRRVSGKLARRWNLVVAETILDRSWGEPR